MFLFRIKSFLLFIFIFGLFTIPQNVWAQEDSENETDEESKKDPTEMSENLKKIFEPEVQKVESVQKTEEKAVSLPKVRLKGKVILKDKPGFAIIEIDQQIIYVKTEDQFNLLLPNNINITLTIKEVSASKVELLIENLKEKIILR